MNLPTSCSGWMPYLLIALLRYVIGSLNPSEVLLQATKIVAQHNYRSLKEREPEEEEEEEEENEKGFDVSLVSENKLVVKHGYLYYL
jgi:hypothetical protein